MVAVVAGVLFASMQVAAAQERQPLPEPGPRPMGVDQAAPGKQVSFVRPVADLRFELAAERLDYLQIMDSATGQTPQLRFRVTRGLVGIEGGAGAWMRARLTANVHQSAGAAPYVAGTDDFGSDAFTAELFDAWLRLGGGRFGAAVLGLQPKQVGLGDRYEELYGLLGGAHHLSPAQLFGVVPQRALGASWQGRFADLVGVDLQVTNAADPGETEQARPKDLVGRIDVSRDDAFAVGGGALFGPRPGGVDTLTWDVYGHARWRLVQATAEALAQKTGDVGAFGWSVSAGVAPDLDGPWLGGVNVTGKLVSFDPDREEENDAWMSVAAGGTAWWATTPARTGTGLTWAMVVPQDVDLAIEHEVVLHTRVAF